MLRRPCAVWATSAWPKTPASTLRGPGAVRDPLEDATGIHVDRDEMGLEVGGHERHHPTAAPGRESRPGDGRDDERCGSGDEESAALHTVYTPLGPVEVHGPLEAVGS